MYDYLQKRLMLKRNEIPARPEVFSEGLSTLFGSASKLIEINIVKNLYRRIEVKFEPRENFSFADHIASLLGGVS